MRKTFLLAAVSFVLGTAGLQAQPSIKPNVTKVLATLTVKAGVSREEMMKVMPGEVRDTVQLYLDGKIEQWYARGDGKGVVFLMNCKTVDEAKEILEALPLLKGNFASFEYMTLGPLSPLRVLMQPAAK